MAKQRTINEIRQTKEYYTGNWQPEDGDKDPVKQVMAQQIEELAEHDKTSLGFIQKKNKIEKAIIENQQAFGFFTSTERDYIEEAKIEIVDKVTKHFQDMLFEMICEEMSNRYVFQSQNYLTEAGMDEFEEQFFEFYHEHHGEIMFKVMKNITN